jgi:putative ABC transport system permease protein
MNWLQRFWRRAEQEEQLDRELQFHIEERVSALKSAGVNEEEARRRLRLEFGGVEQVKEYCRDARGTRWLYDFWQDLRYATRTLAHARGFTVAAVVTLALGFGANSAMFSVIDALLIRPLPYPAPRQLVALAETGKDHHSSSIAYPNFEDWRAQSRAFSQMAAYQAATFNVADSKERPELIVGARVTPNFFTTLGVAPIFGRDFLPSEAEPAGARGALLTSRYWRRRFGSDPAVLGKSITVNFRSYTIVGILPPSFQFLSDSELFLQLGTRNGERGDHNGIYGIGRLKPGITIEQARFELTTIAQRLSIAYRGTNTDQGVSLDPLQRSFAGSGRDISLILFGAVLLVLLIACANVGNLLLARNLTRQREMSVRMALGAGRLRLIRQLLAESLLISLLGGISGLAFARWSLGAVAALVPVNIRQLRPVTLSGSVLTYTATLAFMATLLFGLLPALSTVRAGKTNSLHFANRGGGGAPGQSRVRRVLLVSEVALALVLLVSAGLVIKSFWSLRRVNPGFATEGVVQMRVVYPSPKYHEDDTRVRAFYERVIDGVQHLPGVERAAAVFCPPLGGGCWGAVFSVEGKPPASRADVPAARFNVIAGDYFNALSIPLLAGRTFSEADYAQARPLAIVDQTMARRIWPGQNPVGHRIKIGWPPEGPGDWLEVVGVVADIKRDSLTELPEMEAYVMNTLMTRSSMQLIVRARTQATTLVPSLREAVWTADKDALIYNIGTMEDRLAESLAPRRLEVQLLGAFASLALVLAVIGIAGVVAYTVNQRTAEIGIRVALGAQPSDVLQLILGEGLRLVGAGVVLGLIGAWAATRVLASFLFAVTATDTATFVLVPILLTGFALAASYLPAQRALSIDPANTLHSN